MNFFATPKMFDSISIDGKIWSSDDGYDFDLDYEENDNIPRIFLGENGVGKSLYAQIICYVAFIYHQRNRNPIEKNPNLNHVVQILADLEIGYVCWENDRPRDREIICVETSYTPKYLLAQRKNEIFDIEGVKMHLPSTEKRFYCIKISPKAQNYFETHKILYYSNSQFPNNISFFSQAASSATCKDIDYLFLLSQNKNMLNDIGSVSFELNLNKSYAAFFDIEKEWDKLLYRSDLQDFSNSFLSQYAEIKEYGKNLFRFYNMKTESYAPSDISYNNKYKTLVDDIKACFLYKCMNVFIRDEKFKKEKFPSYAFAIDHFSLIDLFLLRFMQRKGFHVKVRLLIDHIDFDYLNSGKKYDIYLACLKNIYRTGEVLFFLDEPENAHHIRVQESLMRKMPENYQLNMITHSPYLVQGLSKYTSDYIIKLVYRNNKNPRNLIIENAKNVYEDINDISAEFFAYSPVIEKWNALNKDISIDKFISVENFYEEIKKLKTLY
jgi:hypothetical protein